MGLTRKGFGSRVKQGFVSLLLAVPMMVGLNVATATPAHAVDARCGGPRCTVYLNKTETQQFAQNGYIPPIPPGPWMGVVFVTLLSHRAIANGYYIQGYCIRVDASVLPWEGRGMRGYRC